MTWPKARFLSSRTQLWLIGSLGVVVCVAIGRAQPSQSSVQIEMQLKIEIFGRCAEDGKIYIVLNGDEDKAQLLSSETKVPGQFVWIFPWTDGRSPAFPKADLSGSLRFSHSRSYCRLAKEDRDKKGNLVAAFQFYCDRQPVQEVNVLAESTERAVSVPLSYVRKLGMTSVPRGDERDCDFPEKGTASGPLEVFSVRFPAEELRLQIGLELPNRAALGLLVNDRAVIERAENGGHRFLDREGVVCALAAQRAAGKQGTKPDLSSAAMDFDETTLRQIHLKSVDLTVTK
jgi:hypothetical protein